ncbi:MAG: hypothetical protein WC159_00155 [Sphaerochaetaceae bacterium]
MERFGVDNRYTSMVLFETFQEALGDLLTKDTYLFTHPKTKAAIAHRLSEHMQQRLREKLSLSSDITNEFYLTLPKNLVFDICLNKIDIILHDRNGKTSLVVMLYNDYLSKKEVAQLKAINKGKPLTLAVAFLSQKTYVLLYRVNKDTIDYYHYNTNENSSRLRMQRDIERIKDNEEGQLSLIKPRRSKKIMKE